MPFNTLLNKISNDVFEPQTYKDPAKRKFFEFKESDYSSKTEESKVTRKRENPDPGEELDKVIKEELKLGWLLGMDRDRIVQDTTNYSELIRNNCVLKRTVHFRLEKTSKAISGG